MGEGEGDLQGGRGGRDINKFINRNRGGCATALAEDASIGGLEGVEDWLLPSFIFRIWKDKRGRDEAGGQRREHLLAPVSWHTHLVGCPSSPTHLCPQTLPPATPPSPAAYIASATQRRAAQPSPGWHSECPELRAWQRDGAAAQSEDSSLAR